MHHDIRHDDRRRDAEKLAQGLGWFSIGLGLAEVLAPRALAGALGMRRNTGLIQSFGLREMANGLAILSSRNPAPWVWGRVAGDALDLATLAPALTDRNPKQGNAALATAAVVGVTVLDILCAEALSQDGADHHRRARRIDYSDRSGFPNRTIGDRFSNARNEPANDEVMAEVQPG
jgi:hypothetical protein